MYLLELNPGSSGSGGMMAKTILLHAQVECAPPPPMNLCWSHLTPNVKGRKVIDSLS